MKRILFLIVLLVFAFFGCKKYLKIPEIKKVNCYKMTQDDIAHRGIFYGVVKSTDSVVLNFQTEGKIIYLPFSKGDFVKKNTILARIDAVLYKIRQKEEVERLKKAKIQLNRNQNYYKRMDILHAQGAISDNDWEDAYFNLKTTAEEIDIQKQKVDYMNKEVGYTTIVAPYDGYITDRFVGLGANVSQMQPVYSFIGSNALYVEANVNYKIAQKLKVGELAKIKIQNKIYDAKITHVSFSSLNSGGYIIKMAFLKKVLNLKEGLGAEVIFDYKNYYSLPYEVLFNFDNKNFIFKINKLDKKIATLEKIEVRIEKIEGENATVLLLNGNLKCADLILLKDNQVYLDGQKVKFSI